MPDYDPAAATADSSTVVVIEPSSDAPGLPPSPPVAPPRPAAAISPPLVVRPAYYTSSGSGSLASPVGLHHRHYYHHQHHAPPSSFPLKEDVLIPVATPAAAATAATPLPPPYVAVDLSSPVKPYRHTTIDPPAAAAAAAGSVVLSPSKYAAAAAPPPAVIPDVEAGETPFRLCSRVVIFTAAFYVCDGVSLTIRKLRAHLRAKGIDSRVVSCGPEGWSEPDVFTVPCIPLPIVNADDNFGYSLGVRLTEECKNMIRNFDPSLIHFTVPDFLALDALRWAKAEGIPVMGTWHSNYADYLKFYNIEMMRGTVEKYIRSFYVNMPIFVPTPFIRSKLIENGFPKARVGIWGRGVNLELFNPKHRSPAFRRARGIEDDEVVILWVGRLVKEKSPDTWAEVIRRLHKDGLKFRALVVGSGSYETHMRGLPRTECLGWMGGKALAEVYASVDLFLFPSEVETFGNVTLEALASGVPCIASAGCSGHLVQHSVNGFVVHRGDLEEYYNLTKRVVTDASLRQRLAAKARPSIKGLEHARVMDMMLGNYDGVIREHNERGLGDPQQRRVGDRYLSFVYCFFSLVLVVLTPTLKAYVACLKCAHRAWTATLGWADVLPEALTKGATAVGARVSDTCAALTNREMRLLMAILYCFGLYVLYSTWRAAML